MPRPSANRLHPEHLSSLWFLCENEMAVRHSLQEAEMAIVRVHAETQGDAMSAQVNNTQLVFNGSGDASTDVGDGEHPFFFFTAGPPGSAYSVAVVAPPEAKVSASGVIGPSMKATRLLTFHVGGVVAHAIGGGGGK
jgi:hypothetical protein